MTRPALVLRTGVGARQPGPGRTLAAVCAAVCTASWLLAPPPSASARPLDPGEVVLEDAIAVEILDRDVVAFDLKGSGRLVERLLLDERVLFTASRGRVAVVLTDQRLLGATPDSASWQSERYRLSEVPRESAWISQSLALVLTRERALGFYGTGGWAEQRIGPHESFVEARIGPATAVVVTDRRAFGISGGRGGLPSSACTNASNRVLREQLGRGGLSFGTSRNA